MERGNFDNVQLERVCCKEGVSSRLLSLHSHFASLLFELSPHPARLTDVRSSSSHVSSLLYTYTLRSSLLPLASHTTHRIQGGEDHRTHHAIKCAQYNHTFRFPCSGPSLAHKKHLSQASTPPLARNSAYPFKTSINTGCPPALLHTQRP